MVFQNYALYPHMTVEKNIGYGLKNMKVPAEEIKKKVPHIIPGRDIPAVPPAFKKKRLFFFLLFRCLTRSHVMTYLRRLAGCPVSLSVIRLRSVPYCPAPS